MEARRDLLKCQRTEQELIQELDDAHVLLTTKEADCTRLAKELGATQVREAQAEARCVQEIRKAQQQQELKQATQEHEVSEFLLIWIPMCPVVNPGKICCMLEWFSFECHKTKTKVITLTNHNIRNQRNEPIRIRSKYISGLKRGKTRASKSRLVLVWLPIGEKITQTLPTNQSAVKQNQRKREITFDARLKTTLFS